MIRDFKYKCLNSFEFGLWKKHASYFGAHVRIVDGLQLLSKAKSKSLVEDSLLKIKEFDSDMFDQMSDTINMIIFLERGDSGIIPGKGIILISEKDQSHLSTSIHLAGWLLYYFELIRGVKQVGLANWYKNKNPEIKDRAGELRKNFIAGAPPRDAEGGSGSEEINP